MSESLLQQETIPDDVRQRVADLRARMTRITGVLGSMSCLPAQRRKAKDELVALSKACLDLWPLI